VLPSPFALGPRYSVGLFEVGLFPLVSTGRNLKLCLALFQGGSSMTVSATVVKAELDTEEQMQDCGGPGSGGAWN